MTKKSKNKSFEQFDNSFYVLANSLAAVLTVNKLDDTTQKEQVEELVLAEKLFKEEIQKYKLSSTLYKKFIDKIRNVDRNILYSKIYFRENSDTFSHLITPCFKKCDPEKLKQFNINFNLIDWLRTNWRGPLGVKAEKYYQRVIRARRILMENNMPLMVNVCKLFYRKVPKSDVTLMDMISIAVQGLASGVDKYTGRADNGEYSEVFRSVLMGRITGVLIKAYSSTPLHFYPSDRRILYKANSIRGRQGITDVVELAAAVNASFKADALEGINIPKGQVTSSELQELLHAASLVSVECTLDEENFSAYDRTIHEDPNPEESVIGLETNSRIGKLIKELPIIHRKVLRLKGVNF